MADAMREWLANWMPSDKSESPIEALFHGAWQLLAQRILAEGEPVLRVKQQSHIGDYRVDFEFDIACVDGGRKSVIVELDGHAFHERTKEQATRDKARDRWLSQRGYIVLRFTGSEVWANPFAVVSEVSDRLHMVRYGKSRREALAEAGFAAMRKLLGEGKDA